MEIIQLAQGRPITMTNLFPPVPAASDQYRLFKLKNACDMTVVISERGAALHSWRAPDRYGRMADVIQAGADGAARAGQALWKGQHADGGVALKLAAPGGEAELRASYRLDDDGYLTISHDVLARLPTLVRLQTHPCFNLNGGIAGVDDHMLQIDADYYVEVDAGGNPVGLAAVGGTPFDFRHPAPIGARLRWPDGQLSQAGGFDHCFYVGSHFAGGQSPLREVAQVFDPGSGRRLQMYTTEAALQFSAIGDAGGMPRQAPDAQRRRRDWFGLEADARPALVSAGWPQVLLHPGQTYRQTTAYRLSLQG
jgi:aldose 1-epimerase